MSENLDAVTQADRAAEDRVRAARRDRRRFIKATGAMVLAVPVIESITGTDLVTVSAQSQTSQPQGFNSFFTGSVTPEVD